MSIVHRLVINPVTASEWRPDEFGLRRATVLACLPVLGGIAVIAALLAVGSVPPPELPVVVQLGDPLPAMTSPVAAELSPPLEPVTASSPELAMAAPSVTPPPALMAVAELLPDILLEPADIGLPAPVITPQPPIPPRRVVGRPHLERRAATGKLQIAEAPAESVPSLPLVAPLAPARPLKQPEIDTSSGLGAYRAGLHGQIERNMLADETVRRLGIGGVATIDAVIAPDGRVLSATISRGSGTRAIDQAALAAVQRGGYRAFGAHMPASPITISVPITVEAN